MKKYKIRKLSPLWWLTRVGSMALFVAGTYMIVCCMAAADPL